MADWEQDKRAWKRVCLDHTLHSEVYSNKPARLDPYSVVETTTDLCHQTVQFSTQRLPSLTLADAWRKDDHDEQCQNLHTQCNGAAYNIMDQIFPGSSASPSGPDEAARFGVNNAIPLPHAFDWPAPSQQYDFIEQHAACSMPHENYRLLTSDAPIAQNTTLINYSSSQPANTISISNVASLDPSESQHILSGPHEVPSGLPKGQVCFGMV